MNPISDSSLHNLSIDLFKTSKPLILIKGDNQQLPILNNFPSINNIEMSKSIIDENSNLFRSINNQAEFQKGISSSINSDRRESDIVIEKEFEANNRIFIEKDDKFIEFNQSFEKKYKLKFLPENIIKVPINYTTDDEDEFQIVSIINESLQNDWKLVIDDKENNIKVYKKDVLYTPTPLLKTFGEIPFSLKIVMEVLYNYDFRLNWDEIYKKILLVKKLPNINKEYESFIEYSILQFPTIIDDRDFVQKVKIWRNYLGNPKIVLSHNKSVKYYKFPEIPNSVRGEIFIGGFYLEQIKNNLTKVIYVNNLDIKITFGISLINKREIENQQIFIKNLIKGCQMWIQEEKENN